MSSTNRVTSDPQRTTKLYFEWLYRLAINGNGGANYKLLLSQLFRKEWYGFIPNDDNRGEDGKQMRADFEQINDITDVDWLVGPCSMLEMILAICLRIIDICDDNSQYWFSVLIGNLGLTAYTDENYTEASKAQVNRILERLLERTYLRTGKGGLFPLTVAKQDQREVEIWYQMMAWLMENYELY